MSNNQFGHNFKKRFGQNFLKDEKWPKLIADILNPEDGQPIIEIGPGHGILTNQLLKKLARVYAVEIDNELVPFLLNKFAKFETFKLINQDIMQLEVDQNLPQSTKYMMAGSLPYNISKQIVRKFLNLPLSPEKMVYIVQKEVGEDYAAVAPNATFLGICADIYSDVTYHATIPASEFFPTPKVDGAIIEFNRIGAKYENPEGLIKFIKGGYLQPRKKLSVNLSTQGFDKGLVEMALTELNISITARASELSTQMWYLLQQKIQTTQK